MIRIVLDADVARRLSELHQVTDLCDPTGFVIGRFVPGVDWSQWEPISPDVTEEDLDERELETERYTFDEVMAHLKRLEEQEHSGSGE